MASTSAAATQDLKSFVVPPMSNQQEDTVIHSRITNDEKALRRVTKKFHGYVSLAYDPNIFPASSSSSSVDDARDAFLVELASFQLSLKKNAMVCEAEARQVEEYQKERERIAREHLNLKDQIEELKTSLVHAQLERKRKMEYDIIAEKVNTLPSREELEQSIRALENDMAAIRSEHDNQDRVVQAQKTRLDMIVSDLAELRQMGKEDHDPDVTGDEISRAVSPQPSVQIVVTGDTISDAVSNALPNPSGDGDVEMIGTPRTREETGELQEEREEGEEDEEGEEREEKEEGEELSEDDVPLSRSSSRLNPSARAFVPGPSATPGLPSSRGSPSMKEDGEEDDIEMGELAEDHESSQSLNKVSTRPVEREEPEEGEASDLSSELSDLPDDV